jgi:transposase
MRGHRELSGSLFSYVSLEERIPAGHPLLQIRKMVNQALNRLNPTFCERYATEGRSSVPPEQLLLASLLQTFYGNSTERLLLEQLNDNLLFRWFVRLTPDDPILHPITFTKNRERILNDQVMERFLEKLMVAPKVKPLRSDEHGSVDGTLLQAWASHMPRRSGLMARKIRRHRPQGLVRALALQSPARSGPRVISAASSSATRPIAPALIRMRCCAGHPRPIQHWPASGAMGSWTSVMP